MPEIKSQSPVAESAWPATILDSLAAWRTRTPDRVALTILDDGEEVSAQVTFRQLYDDAMRICGWLRNRYPVGTRVVLLLPTGLDFVRAFYGCLAAGMIAVPASNPQQARRKSQWKRLQAIVDNSGSQAILTAAQTVSVLHELRSSDGLFERCEVVDAANLAEPGAAAAVLAVPGGTRALVGSDVAFLQYTSGTTALPRGVAITHENIMNNQQVIAELMGHHSGVKGLSWLPLYHDMGLSALLQMASVGMHAILMPPAAFIQKPLRWLKAISNHQVHSSGGPNFAYQLVASELSSDSVEPIDLSSWQVAFCGAEPIRESTVSAFVELASAWGFKPSAFFPCYGLAEATVAVTGIRKGEPVRYLDVGSEELARGVLRPGGGRADKKIISCGATRAENEVRIINPATLASCDEDEIGEIWVKGKSVGAGYWNNPDATQATFAAFTANGEDGPYMRTGDLGALHDGELYITGRAKDLIIIRGRNLYPQDIEEVVQSRVEGMRKDGGAAFAVVSDQEERLVIVQEVARTSIRSMDGQAVCKSIAAAVVDEFEVMPHEILLVRPASVAKTSSGKIQRGRCRQQYVQGQLEPVARWSAHPQATAEECVSANGSMSRPPAELSKRQIVQKVVDTVAARLKIEPGQLSTSTPWAELGVDSLQAVRLAQSLEDAIGCKLDSTVLWECSNIEELADCIAAMTDAVGSARAASAQHPATSRAASVPAHSSEAITRLSEEEATALLLDEIER